MTDGLDAGGDDETLGSRSTSVSAWGAAGRVRFRPRGGILESMRWWYRLSWVVAGFVVPLIAVY
ncbi:MAG TPA: hypothetical protein VGD55_13310, partial [Acidothermaceae bacterium]